MSHPKSLSEQRLAWLRTLLMDRMHAIVKGVEPLSELFTLEVGGPKFIGATNGHGLTLLRCLPGEDAPPFALESAPLLAQIAAAQWISLPLLDVWKWAMQADLRCKACNGMGFVLAPDLTAFDEQGCGPVFNLWQRCDCQRKGVAYGVVLDKRIVLEFLGPLDAHDNNHEVDFAADPEHRQILLRTPDWIVIVKGLDAEADGCRDLCLIAPPPRSNLRPPRLLE